MTSAPTAPEVGTTQSDEIDSFQEVEVAALPMSPAAAALPPPSSAELESRPATPQGRKIPGSYLSDAAKANVRAAVRNVLDNTTTMINISV